MDERPEGGEELPDGEVAPSADPPVTDGGLGGSPEGAAPRLPHRPEGPEADALAEEAAEIRRMIDAGAGSPEAIRELARRLREHRAREEALWRAEIRPVLKQEGKGRFRGHRSSSSTTSTSTSTSTSPPTKISPSGQALWIGLALLALVAIVVIAANTTVWVLVLPVIALLVWAWDQGRREGS